MAQPELIPMPFAENATPGTIEPIEATTPTVPQDATWSTGFPQVTMQPLAAGGIPPRGQNFNGVLNALSRHIFHMQGGGQYKWSDDHGPYSIGDVLQSDDGLRSYVSVVNNNTDNFNTNPSAIGNTWLPWGGGAASESVAGLVRFGTTAGTAAQGNDSRIVNALQKENNLSDITDPATARNNLGLGTAATRNVGTSSGNVMEVGAFGLGGTPPTLSDQQTNSAVTSQFFSTGDTAVLPYSSAVTLGYHDTGYATQIFSNQGVLTPIVSVRVMSENQWGAPVTLHHTGNILKSTGNNNEFPMSQKAVTDALATKANVSNPGSMGIGVGQTWQDVTGSRVAGTTYTNTTGRTICATVAVRAASGTAAEFSFLVDGVVISNDDGSAHIWDHTITAIIPNGHTYRLDGAGNYSIYTWAELR